VCKRMVSFAESAPLLTCHRGTGEVSSQQSVLVRPCLGRGGFGGRRSLRRAIATPRSPPDTQRGAMHAHRARCLAWSARSGARRASNAGGTDHRLTALRVARRLHPNCRGGVRRDGTRCRDAGVDPDFTCPACQPGEAWAGGRRHAGLLARWPGRTRSVRRWARLASSRLLGRLLKAACAGEVALKAVAIDCVDNGP